jgi:hypothetical protein
MGRAQEILGHVQENSNPVPIPTDSENPELAELLAIRQRLTQVLEALPEEELAAYMEEARDFLEQLRDLPDPPGSSPSSPPVG